MRSPPHQRWLAGSVTVALFTVVLGLHGLPRSASVETPVLPESARRELPGWPMLGGSPARNMVSTTAKNLPVKWTDDDGEPIKANVLWSADLGSRAYGGPVVAGGKVFVGTNNQKPRDPKDVRISLDGVKVPIDLGVMMAFNQADGKFLYQTTFAKLPNGQVNDWPLQGVCSTPTAEGNRLYYTSNRCEVVCADIDTGKIVWNFDMIRELGVFPHNMTACAPLVIGDSVYVITANGVDETHIAVPSPAAPSFLKLDKKTGKVLWQDNSPTINLKPGLLFKDLVDRAELIQHAQWSHPAYAVVGGEAQVVFPGGDGWIRSFTPAGKLIWQFDCNPKDAKYELGGWGTRSDFIGAPVIYNNRVYIGLGQDPEHNTGVGHLWCIDMTKKGDVSPELVVNAAVWPPVTKPNPNSAKVWHFGGFIDAAKVKGRKNYHYGRTMSTCAIHDDIVYAADLGGWLYCLNANTGELHWEHETRSNAWSSPYWADCKVYLGTDAGDVWVFAHGKEKKLLAKNEMSMPVRSTPVAVGEVLYIVSGNKLFALKR